MARPRKTAPAPEPARGSWWGFETLGKHCHRLTWDGGTIGSSRRVLLLADLHWDSAHCERDHLRDTLEVAKAEGAPVFVFGDFYDAMGGRWDPRADPAHLRDDLRTGGYYLDLLVDTAVKWWAPYAHLLALISYGNHETSILRRHEVDLLQRLAHGLRAHGGNVQVGAYWGFILAHINYQANQSKTTKIHYSHGFGGGGEVTRGILDWNRIRGMYHADVYCSGHIHRRNLEENLVTEVTAKGRVHRSRQLFLRCSCWKHEDQGNTGWHMEKGRAARPLGGWWLEFKTTTRPSNPERGQLQGTYEADLVATPT